MPDFNGSKNNISKDYAETIALKVVHFILTDDEMQQNFLNSTGILPLDFESAIKDPGFLGGVLDFLLANEDKLIEFCTENEITPEEPSRVRRLFPGATFGY
jgi:hypothetical protein